MRKAKGIIILGYNGTGKTSFARKLADIELNKKGKVIIITPDPMEWDSVSEIENISNHIGIGKIVYDTGVLEKIYKYYYDGLLIFDDYRAYGITANSKEAGIMKNFLRRKRQYMRDIVFVGHGFTEIIPKSLFTNASHIVLFQTKDNIKKVRNEILNFDLMQKHQKEINELSKIKPVINYMSYHRIIKQ